MLYGTFFSPYPQALRIASILKCLAMEFGAGRSSNRQNPERCCTDVKKRIVLANNLSDSVLQSSEGTYL